MNERDIVAERQRIEKEREAGDTTERQYVKPRPPREPAQVYSIRVPVEKLETLRRLAATLGKAPSAMMRDWIIERLNRETGTVGTVPAKGDVSGLALIAGDSAVEVVVIRGGQYEAYDIVEMRRAQRQLTQLMSL